MLIRTWSFDDAIAILDLTGRLTVESGSAVRDAVADVVRGGRRQIVLNLLGVSAVDASGLGALANALSVVRAADGDLTLVVQSAVLHELLARTQLVTVFPIFPSEAEAITAFAVVA